MAKKPKTLNDQLKAAIVASGLSINQLAAESGVAQSVLCRYMNGKVGISLNTAEKLSKRLRIVFYVKGENDER